VARLPLKTRLHDRSRVCFSMPHSVRAHPDCGKFVADWVLAIGRTASWDSRCLALPMQQLLSSGKLEISKAEDARVR
jgi:hypothetical protein